MLTFFELVSPEALGGVRLELHRDTLCQGAESEDEQQQPHRRPSCKANEARLPRVHAVYTHSVSVARAHRFRLMRAKGTSTIVRVWVRGLGMPLRDP